MAYLPRRLRRRNVHGPRWIIKYPADRPITAEQANLIKKRFLAARESAILLPDNFSVEMVGRFARVAKH